MPLADDWSYTLATAVLEAAVSCGVECEHRFVSDGGRVEQPPPGNCQCQMVAVVREGWEPPRAECGIRRFAEVTLILDLCTEPTPGPNAVPDRVAVNTRAQANAATRWLVMRGLRAGMATYPILADPLPGLQEGTIIPDSWRLIRSTGGMARWETRWRFETNE